MELPSPTELLGSQQVAARLQIDRRSADKLIAAGLAGEVFRTERGVYVRPDAIDALQERPWVDDDHPSALVIRLGPAQPDEANGRAYMGWHELLKASSWGDQLKAIDRWWAIRDPEPGTIIVYVVSTFVVNVATLGGSTLGPGGLRVLQLTDPKKSVLAAFDGRRVRTGRGGNVIWI